MSADPNRPPRPNINAQGELVFEAEGLHHSVLTDLYHELMVMSWTGVLGMGFLGYVLINVGFMVLFALEPGCVEGARGVTDLFWFSVQTLSTIGYGGMAPATPYGHVLVTLESFVGLTSVALATGLVFAKFSRPSARVVFSEPMVVHERDGVPCLMFRMANERRNQVAEARVAVTLLKDEITAEGHHLRRFIHLPLERDTSPVFALTWTIIHRLDETSPLYGLSRQNRDEMLLGMVVSLTGLDGTLMQTVHARHMYFAEAIEFDAKFSDMVDFREGRLKIDFGRLHETEPTQRS
ncbi:MAG: ATP-sensitive inward rectifier potassium channel 10 [Alphaproteobacteria bacterium]|nr:ATP-sensitive inward rectifier potassium channel 10 [Alphaproteobacteria bacterium]